MKEKKLTSKDLMVGDWLRQENGSTFEVTGNMLHAMQDFNTNISRYRFEPIPITPEILEKNGFEYDKFIDNLYCNDSLNDRPLFLEPINGAFEICVMNVYVKIKYVHELQHAMRLCGIDKQIKLCD